MGIHHVYGDAKFSTKKYEVPKKARVSYIEEIQKSEKKKVGPSSYSVSEKGEYLAKINKHGVFNGIIKKNTEQLAMLDHIRT